MPAVDSESDAALVAIAAVGSPERAATGPSYQMTRQGLRELGGRPDDAAAHYELGVAYLDTGLYDDAVAELRKALHGRHMEVRTRTMIARCLLLQTRIDDAISELRRALDVGGAEEQELVNVYYSLGRAYE